MEYLRAREHKLRDTNESTNERVKWFAFGTMGMLIGLGVWQVVYLRAYFRYVVLAGITSIIFSDHMLPGPSILFSLRCGRGRASGVFHLMTVHDISMYFLRALVSWCIMRLSSFTEYCLNYCYDTVYIRLEVVYSFTCLPGFKCGSVSGILPAPITPSRALKMNLFQSSTIRQYLILFWVIVACFEIGDSGWPSKAANTANCIDHRSCLGPMMSVPHNIT